MLNEHDIKDWIFTEAQQLNHVQPQQAFVVPCTDMLFKPLYEAAGKIYSEVITDGQYKGLAFAFPSFLTVRTYDIKH